MRRFRGCRLSWHLKLSNIYEGVINASVNTYCKIKLVYLQKRFRVESILKWRVYIKLKVSWLRTFLCCKSQTSRDRVNSRRVRTHEKNSGVAVRRLGTIIQSLNVWKWSGESRYPGAFPLVLENFLRAFSPGPTNRPWVSEDDFAINYSIARGRNLSTVEIVVTIFILIAL